MSPIVRPATPAELRRIPVLLPRWQFSPADECLVAEASHPSRLVGMSIFGKRPGENEKAVAHLDIAIVPRFRNPKVIDSLLFPLLQRAAQLGLPEAHLVTPQRRANPLFHHFEEIGFTAHQILISHEFSVPAFAARTKSVYQRLLSRHAIPAGAEVVPLSPKLWSAAAQLATSENLVDARMQAEVQKMGLNACFNSISRVLLLNDKVAGVLLARGAGREAEALALTVIPALRGGLSWANALLNYHGGLIANSLGYEIFIMGADPARHPMSTPCWLKG